MNESTSSGFRANPAAVVPGAAVSAQAQQLLTFHQNTASMLDTMLRFTLTATQHAQQVVLPGTEAKIAEMQGLLVKEAEMMEREKKLEDSKHAHIAEKEKHAGTVKEFETVKQNWKTDRENEERSREQQRYARYVGVDQLMLPSALCTEEARALIHNLIPILEGTPKGWRLRAALSAAALAETGSDDEDFMKAVQELFEPAQAVSELSNDLISHLKRLLSNHGKDPIIVEIPASGESYNTVTMTTQNPELSNGRPIVRVLKWGVRFANKDRRKRVLVS